MSAVGAARFRAEGNEIIQRSRRVSARVEDARFRAHFGTSADVCCDLWSLIRVDRAKPFHLLWALMLLKLYCSESVLCTLAGGVHEQTFRKWAWLFVNEISELQYSVVSGDCLVFLGSHFSHTQSVTDSLG
jgi:hypothetical protein